MTGPAQAAASMNLKSVARLFHKHGIETEPHYDETTLSYYFLKEPHATTQQEA